MVFAVYQRALKKPQRMFFVACEFWPAHATEIGGPFEISKLRGQTIHVRNPLASKIEQAQARLYGA
jgi:hypothetical protein